MNIPAIPTQYAGVNFRSRLEARWARFFDKCGWGWQYEPIELNGWLPDFLLEGGKPILVEVKPLAAPFVAEDVIAKMEAGCRGTEWGDRELLLLGLAPSETWAEAKTYDRHGIGLIGETYSESENLPAGRDWQTALLGEYGSGQLDFSAAYGGYEGRIFGGHHSNPGGECNGKWKIHAGWADAGNRTQWKPVA